MFNIINVIVNKLFFGGNDMAAKKNLEGVELANDIMLNDLAAFLVSKKYYGKLLVKELQESGAKKDILLKSGKLRKLLEKEGIKTRFDIALNHTDSCFDNFGDFAKIMKQYRAHVIKKAFQHRKDECK